jgi:hypothetical protein
LPNFGTEINTGNISENWLFILNNDNSGAVHLSFKDEMYNSNFYHGVILNKPFIRESVDLANSTSKSGNISINIPDFSYQGSPISEELFGGSNHYINQVVSVHSTVNGQTPIQIGSFRLIDISSDGTKLSISMTSHRPWDFISIPQDKTETMVHIPISYGDYTKNPYGTSSSFLTSKDLYPCPNINHSFNDNIYFAYAKSYGSDAKPHYYDSNIDQFIPFEDSSDSTSSLVDANCVGMPVDMEQGYFLIRPFNCSGWSDSSHAIDTDISTPATATTDPDVAGEAETTTDESRLVIDVPVLDTELTELYVYVKGEITHNDISGNTYTSLRVNDSTMITRSSDGTSSTGGHTINGNSGYSRIDAFGTSSIDINLYTSSSGDQPNIQGDSDGEGKIYDVVLQLKAKNDMVDEKTASYEKASKVSMVYTGGDGLANSWDASPITKINEAHRDMLIRYAGLSTDTPENWANLDADKDWSIRWWALEEVELKEALEQLQYEGGFIFRYRADGTPQYIHIRDTNTTNETLSKYDVADLTIKPTSFSELLTKMEVSYEKHPAENRYLTTKTAYADTARTNWNIRAKENVSQVSLDAYVAPAITEYDNSTDVASSSPNDDFFAYYYNIFGDIKTIVSGKIVNPKYYNLEVGDIVEFSNIYPEKIFGESWSGKQYMITTLQRTLGVLTFESREI